jgi:hypothetical protein
MKEGNENYREDILFPILFVPLTIIGFLSGMFFYKWVRTGKWVINTDYFLFKLFFVLFLVLLNFVRMTIKISGMAVRVTFGLFGRTIPVENIEKVYPDEASALNYGGWGIRLGWFKGRIREAWTVIGAPRLVLKLKKAKIPEFVFSTKKPEEVEKIIEKNVKSTGTKKG